MVRTRTAARRGAALLRFDFGRGGIMDEVGDFKFGVENSCWCCGKTNTSQNTKLEIKLVLRLISKKYYKTHFRQLVSRLVSIVCQLECRRQC